MYVMVIDEINRILTCKIRIEGKEIYGQENNAEQIGFLL